jgi:hypothetical protein
MTQTKNSSPTKKTNLSETVTQGDLNRMTSELTNQIKKAEKN